MKALGCLVTIPHKESIIPYLDEVRGAASVIGAVNTIVPEVVQKGWAGLLARRETKLIGYNTDWLGMYRPILKKLRQRGIVWDDNRENDDGVMNVGIVIGAGGTARAACYAVKELGLDVVVINRSAEKGLGWLKCLMAPLSLIFPASCRMITPSSMLLYPRYQQLQHMKLRWKYYTTTSL